MKNANANAPTILIVPGLRDHVPEHWQTLLEQKLPNAVPVPRMQQDKLSCAAWVAMLDASLERIEGPVILVAHSAGVMIVAHWAQKHSRAIEGALLATPPDFDSPLPEGYPTKDVLAQNGWLPIPRAPLPFRSIVAGSSNDPLARGNAAELLAGAWSGRFVDLGNVGHLNPASGYGDWPQAEQFIRELAR
ncbi:MAG TPA: alpha/beta hydrolase [Casimicrobiaceae bacterium]|jgi:hypothetical protein